MAIKTNIVERYANGQVIISEGIVSGKAYVINSGKVRIIKKQDNRSVTVAVLREGDTFGEMGLFQDGVRSATAIAVGDVAVGVIDKEQFAKMLGQCPEIMQIIVRSMVNRLRLTTNSLAAIGVQLEKARKSFESISTKNGLK
jgi:CRP/FNR family cyclic AMP-dependent transcriptional regulator